MDVYELGLDNHLNKIATTPSVFNTAIPNQEESVAEERTSTTIILSDGHAVRSGQEEYAVGSGFFLGTVDGFPYLSIGDSAGDQLTYNGQTGVLTVPGGATIGGFDVGADYIRDVANSFGLASTVTGGDDVRFWAGDTFANRATADFRITESGAVTATSIAISTSSSTIAGTALINTKTAENVQTRAEALFTDDLIYLGRYDDGFTEDTAGATVTRNLVSTYVETNATSTSNGGINGGVMGRVAAGTTIKWNTYDSQFHIVLEMNTNTVQDAFWGFFRTGSGVSDDATSTISHIGFYLQDATLYVSNANDTTQTRTDVTAQVTILNPTYYKFVYDVGTNIKFYADDVLIATHATNLPTNTTNGEEPNILITLKTQENVLKQMVFKNNYMAIFNP